MTLEVWLSKAAEAEIDEERHPSVSQRPPRPAGAGRGSMRIAFMLATTVAAAAACSGGRASVESLRLIVDAPGTTCWEVFAGAVPYTPSIPGGLPERRPTSSGCGEQTVAFASDVALIPDSVEIRIVEGQRLTAELWADGEVADSAELEEPGEGAILSH